MNVKDVQETLRDWYSPNKVSQFRMLQLAMMGFGMTEEEIRQRGIEYLGTSVSTGTGGGIIYFPPIMRSFGMIRESNPILKNMRILASQVRGVDIVPDWQGVPTYQNEARKSWWNTRCKGSDGYTSFKNDSDKAFLDFAMIGVGYLRVCVNTYDDVQRASASYVSPLDVISDPYLDIDESSGVGIVSIMGRDEFNTKFSGKRFDEYQQNFFNPSGFVAKGVRVIEWFSQDKYMAFPDTYSNEPLMVSENPFGCIPIQAFTNFIPSGSVMPMGLVEMQLSSAMDIIEMTSDIRQKARNDGFIAIEPGFFTKESLERYKNTRNIEYLQIDTENARVLYQLGAKPFIEIPRNGANPDTMNLLQISMQENREQSAVSAQAAGVQSSAETTATEIRSIDNRMDSQYRALLRTFTRSYAGFCVKLAKVAEQYDNAPFSMSYLGVSINMNDGDPEKTSELVWAGAKIPTFEDETLFSQDAVAKMAMEAGKYEKIFALTQSPEAIKKIIEALGVDNADSYINQPQQSPMDAMAGMMGGQMPQGQPPLPEDEGNVDSQLNAQLQGGDMPEMQQMLNNLGGGQPAPA